jgi:hypothetical protein
MHIDMVIISGPPTASLVSPARLAQPTATSPCTSSAHVARLHQRAFAVSFGLYAGCTLLLFVNSGSVHTIFLSLLLYVLLQSRSAHIYPFSPALYLEGLLHAPTIVWRAWISPSLRYQIVYTLFTFLFSYSRTYTFCISLFCSRIYLCLFWRAAKTSCPSFTIWP